MEEIWKPVRGFEEYEVSNYGEVKSLNYKRTGKEKLLSLGKNRKGYLYVVLYKNGVGKHFRINRLVYMTFVGEIPEDIQVNHIDEDKHNNRLDNLNLMTSKENMRWGTGNARRSAVMRGRKRPDISAVNKNNPKKSKAVQALNPKTLEVVMEFPSTAEAQRQGFDAGSVSKCCRNCFNRPGNNVYKGFIWRFRLPQ